MYYSKQIYKKSKLLGGYALMVLDDAGFKTKYVHLLENHLALYLQKFGQKVIHESEFLDWWTIVQASKNT
jgi:hypothetical protein